MVPKFCPVFLLLHLEKEFIITFSEDIVALIRNVLILLQLCAELMFPLGFAGVNLHAEYRKSAS